MAISDYRRQPWRLGQHTVWGVEEGRDNHQPKVLVLHGLGSDVDEYHRLLGPLGQQRRFVAYDQPGFGPHAHEPVNLTIEEMADVAAQVIAARADQQVDLLGASMGGLIGLCLMARHPRLVRRAVILAPAGANTHRPRAAGALHTLAKASLTPLGEAAYLALALRLTVNNLTAASTQQEWLTRFARRRSRTALGVQGHNFFAAAANVSATAEGLHWAAQAPHPTLLLFGEADQVITQKAIDAYAQALPAATVKTLPGGHHSLPLLHPEWVLQEAMGHLG